MPPMQGETIAADGGPKTSSAGQGSAIACQEEEEGVLKKGAASVSVDVSKPAQNEHARNPNVLAPKDAKFGPELHVVE